MAQDGLTTGDRLPDNVRRHPPRSTTVRHVSLTAERSGLWTPPTEGDDQAVIELESAHRTVRGRVPERSGH